MHASGWQWRRAAESPWFYMVWFSLFGAVVLLVAHEKYGQRQSGIERRFQARSQVAAPGGAPQPAASETPPVDYSSPDNVVIPLWPIGVLLAVLSCASAVLAVRAGVSSERGGEEGWGNGGKGE